MSLLAWYDQNILLYHATIDTYVGDILRRVNANRGRLAVDFGRGFYTTTDLQQARKWAYKKAVTTNDTPAVIEFEVDRNALAVLDGLFFVRGDSNAFDFWSFVQYCRSNGEHNRTNQPGTWYDIVAGPVVGSLKKQTTLKESDQISFHTKNATSVLDSSKKTRVV